MKIRHPNLYLNFIPFLITPNIAHQISTTNKARHINYLISTNIWLILSLEFLYFKNLSGIVLIAPLSTGIRFWGFPLMISEKANLCPRQHAYPAFNLCNCLKTRQLCTRSMPWQSFNSEIEYCRDRILRPGQDGNFEHRTWRTQPNRKVDEMKTEFPQTADWDGNAWLQFPPTRLVGIVLNPDLPIR